MSKRRPLPVFSDALVGGDASFLSFAWDFGLFRRVAMGVERRTNGRTRDKDFFSTRPRRVRAAGLERADGGGGLRGYGPWRAAPGDKTQTLDRPSAPPSQN